MTTDGVDDGPAHVSPHRRVAYVIGTYPTLTTTFIDREIHTLNQFGVVVDVVSVRRPHDLVVSADTYRAPESRTTYLLPPRLTQLALAHGSFAVRRPVRYFRTVFELVTARHPNWMARMKTVMHFGEAVLAAYQMRDADYDHVHAHFIDRASTIALVIGRLLDLPYSLTAHARSIYWDPVLIPMKLGGSAFAVTVSEYNKARLLEMAPDLSADHIAVLHPWVDVDHFRPLHRLREGSQFSLLSVGRLVEKKGHNYLIEACRLLADEGLDFHCHIVGDGPLWDDLESTVAALNLSGAVHLHGAQPQSFVVDLLQEADAFALACVVAETGDRDGIPVSLAEAMAMELPVISTDVAGISELVQPGTGRLVAPRDPRALAEAIRELVDAGPQGRKLLGRRGRAVVSSDFDLTEGTRRLSELFHASHQ